MAPEKVVAYVFDLALFLGGGSVHWLTRLIQQLGPEAGAILLDEMPIYETLDIIGCERTFGREKIGAAGARVASHHRSTEEEHAGFECYEPPSLLGRIHRRSAPRTTLH